MRGRKPKPAAIRALHRSKRRPSHRAEPKIPTTAEPIAPAPLASAERAYWDQFAPLLAGARILTAADVETLADYCRACVAVEERSRRLRIALQPRRDKDGEEIPFDARLVKLLDAQLRGWLATKTKLAGELGLTAIARTRVAWQSDASDQPPSKLAELQAQAATLRRPVRVK